MVKFELRHACFGEYARRTVTRDARTQVAYRFIHRLRACEARQENRFTMVALE